MAAGSDDFAEEDMEASEENQDPEAEVEENAGVEPASSGNAGEGKEVSGKSDGKDINTETFDELALSEGIAGEVQTAWKAFLANAESREAAGEAIYAALFDSAPSLQSLFKTPRAVMAMRFMNGLSSIIASLHVPKELKIIVETLGFQHLDLEVTVPRVVIFRDAILDLIQVDMGAAFSKKAKEGFAAFLNYVGGAYIYVRLKYTDRLRILASSWATANNKVDELAMAEEAAENGEEKEGGDGDANGEVQSGEAQAAKKQEELAALAQQQAGATKRATKKKGGLWSRFGASTKSDKEGEGEGGASGEGSNLANNAVPTTFKEMFLFNAAVMGFGNNRWMNEVLDSFDTIVTNVSNSYRLQEECDVLSLRIAKYKGTINLYEFKAVMLASLRSLVPKDWNSAHEVAWSWLWENVERMIKSLMGKPAVQERALEQLWGNLTEAQTQMLRRQIYAKFFALAPAGQDYFKQSTTRLHFIADKIVSMTLDIYKNPKKMVEDISALGLRHVGYGIPTELFGPFVTASVQVVRMLTQDPMAEEAFRWSASLISRILVRTIQEGSTIVMKAINSNSAKQVKKAVACAPRGKRARWMLDITVGTQSISPLYWAIESGAVEAASAMIVDLLTFRADRDRYYYGLDQLFERHPDIIKRMCADAPALLPVLLEGLIWRSRITSNGFRRVNFFIKHLIQEADGSFSKAIQMISEARDAKLVCHPVIVLLLDITWNKLVYSAFLIGKSVFIMNLLVFAFSQCILGNLNDGNPDEYARVAIFACRLIIYIFSMGRLFYTHTRHAISDVLHKNTVKLYWKIHVPKYLLNPQDLGSLVLLTILLLMFILEPITWCLQNQHGDYSGSGLFTTRCPEASGKVFIYSVLSMFGMLLYFALILDMTVFSTRVSAFALVCGCVLSEVVLFVVALAFITLTFSSAISALSQDNIDFQGIPQGMLSLMEMALRCFNASHYIYLHDDPALLIAVIVYLILTVVFFMNLLIAQLNSSYLSVFEDMLGFARLNRGKTIVETMPSISAYSWEKFLTSLKLDERIEFNEGDVGLAGGIQILEPANLNPTTQDMIKRFGGSTSELMQWPEDDTLDDEDDRFTKMEKMIEKAMARMTKGGTKSKGGAKGSNEASNSRSGASGDEIGSGGSSSQEDVEGGD